MESSDTKPGLLVVASGRPVWLDVARILDQAHGLTPAIWTGDARLFAAAQEAYPECLTIDTIDWLRKGPAIASPAAEPTLSWMASDASQRARRVFFKLCSRLDMLGSFRSVDMDALFCAISLALSHLFATRGITHAVFAESPHDPVSYVAYELARFQTLRMAMLQSSSIAPMVFCKQAIEGAHFANAPASACLSPTMEAAVTSFVDRVATAKSHADFIPPYIERQMTHDRSSRSRHASRLRRAVAQYSRRIAARGPAPRAVGVVSSGLPMSRGFPYELAIERGRHMRRKRLREVHAAAVDWDARERLETTPYAFYPLHYEPERTTVPEGGRFSDQLDALIALRSLLPRELPIVVKEHYSQFSDRLAGHLGRSPYFYEAARLAGNVIIVPEDTDTHWLLRNARVVAVITGTAGLEAAILGTPVVTMGHPWYAGCPGTSRWAVDLKWSDVLKSDKGTPDSVKRFLIDLHRTSAVVGVVNPSNYAASKAIVPEADWSEEPLRIATLLAASLMQAKH